MNWEDRIAEFEAREFIAAASRSNPGETPLDFCRRIVDTKSAMVWVGDGPEMLVDMFSASAVTAVYDALQTDSAREKLQGMTLFKAVHVCMKVAAKHS